MGLISCLRLPYHRFSLSSAIKRTQERYFEILEDFFGDHFERMRQTGKPAKEVALEAVRVYTDSMVKTTSDQLRGELNTLWMGQTEQLRSEIRGIDGVKAFYGGAVTPTAGLDFVRRSALYVDTTIIADPVGSFLGVEHVYNPSALVHRLVLYSLNLLELRDLILACGEVPPLTIIPALRYRPKTETKHLADQMNSYTIDFCSEAMGREFASIQDLTSFISDQGSLKELLKHLTRPELLSDPDRSLDPYSHLEDAMTTSLKNKPCGYYTGLEDPKLLTNTFLELVAGEFGGISDVLFCSRSDVLKTEPVTDVKRHWGFLNWVFRRDSVKLARNDQLSADALVFNALMRDDFRWLGNVPIKDVARLRERGELKEIRTVFSDGIRNLGSAEPNNLDHVVEQVKDNWNRAVDRHKDELRKLWMYAGLSAGAVVGGTLYAVVPVFGPLAMFVALMGAPGMVRDVRELHEQRKRPVGILLKAHGKPT